MINFLGFVNHCAENKKKSITIILREINWGIEKAAISRNFHQNIEWKNE